MSWARGAVFHPPSNQSTQPNQPLSRHRSLAALLALKGTCQGSKPSALAPFDPPQPHPPHRSQAKGGLEAFALFGQGVPCRRIAGMLHLRATTTSYSQRSRLLAAAAREVHSRRMAALNDMLCLRCFLTVALVSQGIAPSALDPN